MLRGRIFIPITIRGNHSPAGIPYLNHCIDIAAPGGNVGVGELFLWHRRYRKLALKQILASERA